MLTPLHSTLIGCLAPIAWSSMAMLIVMVRDIPPLETVTLMLSAAALTSFLFSRIRHIPFSALLRQPMGFYLTGVCGLFGFFFTQFLAFRNIPPVEAFILINLWPLMMLFLAFVMFRDIPNRWHILFSFTGVCGVFIVAFADGFRGFSLSHGSGVLFGLTASFFWAGYSVLNRRYRGVPLDTIAIVFAAVSLLAGMSHLLFEETISPTLRQWLIIGLMGSLPEGLALYAWNHGVQHGDLRTLSTVSYLSPILGALLLVFLTS